MQQLDGARMEFLPISNLERVRDLAWFDGPVISHLKHPKGDHYLYLWSDCSDEATRWMLVRVSETNILRLIDKAVPLDYVIPHECLDDFVYFVDAGDESAVSLVALEQIPKSYFPKRGVYLEVTDVDSPEFSILIERPSNERNIFNFPRIFSQAYSVIYSLSILKMQNYEKIPWEDGLKGFSFGQWLLRQIPGQDRPEVSEFRFASPGFVKFNLLRSIAEQVTVALKRYEDDSPKINKLYHNLAVYIRENQLNKLKHDPNADWSAHNKILKQRTLSLVDAIGVDGASLAQLDEPFDAAKVTLYLVRRLWELAKYEGEGAVRFPMVRE